MVSAELPDTRWRHWPTLHPSEARGSNLKMAAQMNGLYKSQCIFEEGRLKSNTLADISFEHSGEGAAIGKRVAADSQAKTLNRTTWLELRLHLKS